MEKAFSKACADGTIPGAVLMAANKDGSFSYSKAFGVRSLQSHEPMTLSTIMWMASCTKLMTSIAALQCIERGEISLETDVAPLLPELADLGILTGFDQHGEPIIEERKNTITLRNLLAHTSGTPYEANSPLLTRYRLHRHERIGVGPTVIARGNAPLAYEPGSDWSYGTSIDWVGKLIERLTDLSLEKYMRKYIWSPLGINTITFWRHEHPELMAEVAHVSTRDPKGSGKVVHGGPDIGDSRKVRDCFGGQGCSASISDFLKILQSLLKDDGVLLKRESVEKMFRSQLTGEERVAMRKVFASEELSKDFVGAFPDVGRVDWGIGGLLTGEGRGGWRGRNTLVWSGMPNLFWFIDREKGLCGVYGGQVFPPGDRQVGEMITLFERSMYEQVAKVRAKL